jgi:ATP-dependent HslUV protease subunit HslV
MSPKRDRLRSTTIVAVRHGGKTVLAGDGQVTLNDTVVKGAARKVRRMGEGKVIAGFAGSAADGMTLFERFESKLKEYGGNFTRAVVELAKDWRTDRVLRQLQAHMIVAGRDVSFLVSGNGDLMQPDEDGVLAIGSGGNYAMAAARALLAHTSMPAADIVREAMAIAARICIYTNDHLTLEEI